MVRVARAGGEGRPVAPSTSSRSFALSVTSRRTVRSSLARTQSALCYFSGTWLRYVLAPRRQDITSPRASRPAHGIHDLVIRTFGVAEPARGKSASVAAAALLRSEIVKAARHHVAERDSLWAQRVSALRQENRSLRATHQRLQAEAELATELPDHNKQDAATQTRDRPFANSEKLTSSTPIRDESYVRRLEARLEKSEHRSAGLQHTIELYERRLRALQACVDEGGEVNALLQTVIDKLKGKLSALEVASKSIKAKLDSISRGGAGRAVSPALARPGGGSVRRHSWDPLKPLFSVFAGLFLASALVLYNVSDFYIAARRYVRAAPVVSWRWMSVQDLLDFVCKTEHVGGVPV